MIELLHVEAASHRTTLLNGRTKPIVCGCIDQADPPRSVVELDFVVKLRSRVTEHEAGLMKELVGSFIAQKLGLQIPIPAIVEVPFEFASALSNHPETNDLLENVGPNFGSELKSDGYGVFPRASKLTNKTATTAGEIFFFDAFIQNPDRMYTNNKPNFLVKGEEFVPFDHELAFSFLLDIFGDSEPWTLGKCPFLRDHVFFERLRGNHVELDRVHATMDDIDDTFWQQVRDLIPVSWMNEVVTDKFEKIVTHCQLIIAHKDEFIENIRRFLL